MSIETTKTISFIGCGNMAAAIIGGLVQSGWPSHAIMASNSSRPKLDALKESLNIAVTQDNQQALDFADIVVLAVKPQVLPQVCQQLNNIQQRLLISVAAGIPTQQIGLWLSQPAAVVRAMPNTPALIQQGATGLFANELVNAQQKHMAEIVFDAVGHSVWVEQESQMDLVTAIAGSSPAYFFLMMQAMLEQAVAGGIEEKAAFELISQSMLGAASLARARDDISLEQLRRSVTSPGGTTAAAIQSFQQHDFKGIIKQALAAAVNRGKALAEENNNST
jgi:pyrroline-5-carboxylate reductase